MAKQSEYIAFRVDPETKRLLAELAKQDGQGVSEVLRNYAREQIEARRHEDDEAAAWIRENLGEKAARMVQAMGLRPTQYLEAWRRTHPPEPTAEERRAVEIDVAGKMGLPIEEYDDGKERGNDAET